MQRDIAHYTLVRLLPQVDAGEFANVGVVLACPRQGYFEFRLIKRYGRVTRFFEEFTGELFLRVRREVEAELRHIRTQIGESGARDQSLVLRVLQDLTKPRESMVRYAPLRMLITDDPKAETDRLVARYVQRNGEAMRQRREEVLTRHVGRVLRTQQLGHAFEPEEVGPDEFPVQLPLVYERDGEALAAIKPLDLTQDEPVKIYEHGDLWVGRLRRLKQLGALPAGMLVAVEGPNADDPRRYRAYADIVHELGAIHIEVTEAANNARILEFAQARVALA
ncbi:MAG TPA: DUF3037 domain-containing protein [Burkholderiaceae bacterium]|nr:DUF3037 domain-containing protein [Burkholderiaceae bacterium]